MVGGIWGVKLRPKILFDDDFILMWSTAYENCRIRIFGIMTYPGIAHCKSTQLVSKC